MYKQLVFSVDGLLFPVAKEELAAVIASNDIAKLVELLKQDSRPVKVGNLTLAIMRIDNWHICIVCHSTR